MEGRVGQVSMAEQLQIAQLEATIVCTHVMLTVGHAPVAAAPAPAPPAG